MPRVKKENAILNIKLALETSNRLNDYCAEVGATKTSVVEQQKIANFLSDFDTAIDLAKKEMEKWKLLKKGLLQQMFV